MRIAFLPDEAGGGPAAPTIEAPQEEAQEEVLSQEEEPTEAPAEGEEAGTEGEEAEQLSPEDALLQAIEELGEDHPVTQKLREKLGPQEDPEQAYQRDLQLHQERSAQAATALRDRANKTVEEVRAAAESWGQDLQQYAATVAQDRIDKDDDAFRKAHPELFGVGQVFDGRTVGDALAGYVQRAQQESSQATEVALGSALLTAIRSHPVAKGMTKEERADIAAIANQERWTTEQKLSAAVWTALNAAQRQAPETVKREAEEQAKKKTSQAEKLERAVQAIKGNGRRPAAAAPGGRKRYADMTYEERSKLTAEQRDEIIARENTGGVR